MTTITVSARTHSLVLTKSFAAKAAIFGSDEYKMLQEARRDYPGYKVTVGKSKARSRRTLSPVWITTTWRSTSRPTMTTSSPS